MEQPNTGRTSKAQPGHPRDRTPTVMAFKTAQGAFEGSLNDTETAQAIRRNLPISSTVQRWGEEIYFEVPVSVPNEQPTRTVQVGDIAYWPDGPCVCIFFGRTPASLGREPRPASEVTVIGHTEAPAELLRTVEAGTMITMAHAG